MNYLLKRNSLKRQTEIYLNLKICKRFLLTSLTHLNKQTRKTLVNYLEKKKKE